MIDLYFWATPNGYKPLICLEETKLDYTLQLVNIFRGEQFNPTFLAISPNNRIPALVEHAPKETPIPVAIFESGAILLYLAEKTGMLLPDSLSGRYEAVQWLMWQMSGLGPMAGQAYHFLQIAPEDLPYAKSRYLNETKRLLEVLEKRLLDREYLAGSYSIADIAVYPWVKSVGMIGINLTEEFPHIAEWTVQIAARPAVQRAYEIGEPTGANQKMDEEAREHLFAQTQKQSE